MHRTLTRLSISSLYVFKQVNGSNLLWQHIHPSKLGKKYQPGARQ